MGRQIAIRTGPSDRAALEAEVARAGGLILAATSEIEAPTVVPASEGVEQRFPGVFWLCLAVEVAEVSMRPAGALGYWTVDQISAPVVEYSTRKVNASGIGDGRLWYETGHFVGNERRQRSPDFVEFAGHLFRWVRRHHQAVGKPPTFVGAEARLLDDRGS